MYFQSKFNFYDNRGNCHEGERSMYAKYTHLYSRTVRKRYNIETD